MTTLSQRTTTGQPDAAMVCRRLPAACGRELRCVGRGHQEACDSAQSFAEQVPRTLSPCQSRKRGRSTQTGEWEFEEGCLSIPEHWWEFARPSFARAVGQDLEGDPVEYSGEELLGRVLQHETDHLVGELVIDRLGRSARKRALAELREAKADDRLGRS